MKIAIFNDTALGAATTGGIHFGCELVMETMLDLLEQNGHEVVQRVPSSVVGEKVDRSADLVIVNGEGSLHHNRRKELLLVAQEAPSILINTVWQEMDSNGLLDHFKYIAARESRSQAEMPVEADVVPDLLFANKRLRKADTYPRHPQEDIGVTDSVLNQLKGGDGGFTAIQNASTYIEELKKYKRVCCGRFHAVAACAVLGIPFSAWQSNTHKIEGMMEDMGVLEHFYYMKDDAMANIPTTYSSEIELYVQNARTKIHSLFERLEDFV